MSLQYPNWKEDYSVNVDLCLDRHAYLIEHPPQSVLRSPEDVVRNPFLATESFEGLVSDMENNLSDPCASMICDF